MNGAEGYTFANTVTPSDGTPLAVPVEALVFGSTGNAVLIMKTGATVTLPVTAAVVYKVAPAYVKATGHTAGTVTALA